MYAGNIEPQESLINQLLDVTLNRFHVYRYPGSSQHTIQINFSIEHLVNLAKADPDTSLTTQQILYGYVVNARDEQAVPAIGVPIFRRLRIRDELQMKIATIHLADRKAKQMLEVLESDAMKKGLTLLSTTNPVFPMVSGLVDGATRLFLSCNANKPVHKIEIGFLISTATANPKLREGSYVLIQADVSDCDLANYRWNQEKGRIEDKELEDEIPYNYMILSIEKSKSPTGN